LLLLLAAAAVNLTFPILVAIKNQETMNVGLAFTSWGRRLGKSLLKLKKTPKNCFETNRWNIVKGDLVEVIQGPQTGQRGKVLDVIRETNRITIDGVNMVSCHRFISSTCAII
jgi:transcription antitermination factor NusG